MKSKLLNFDNLHRYGKVRRYSHRRSSLASLALSYLCTTIAQSCVSSATQIPSHGLGRLEDAVKGTLPILGYFGLELVL